MQKEQQSVRRSSKYGRKEGRKEEGLVIREGRYKVSKKNRKYGKTVKKEVWGQNRIKEGRTKAKKCAKE